MNIALLLFTADYRTVQTPYSETAIHLGGLYVPIAKFIAFAVAMVLSGLLWVFLHTTDLGKAMRAAAQNRDVAMLMGINPDRVFCVAVGVALALAGAAGSLLMPFYPAYPLVGQVFVLMAFVAVVLGTLGNVTGALIASLMMGVAELLGIQFVGADSGLIVVFAMLLLTLAIRPNGSVRRVEPMMQGLISRGGFWVGVLAAAALALPLLVSSAFAIDIFIRILLFAFIGVAWNLMGGYAKQLSLGHAAYFGLGAYTSTILLIRYGVSPWIGMLAGGVVAMLASLPIGALCFRLRGPYFAIATIATAQVLMLLFLKFRDFAWGAEGTTMPNLGQCAVDDAVRRQGAILLHPIGAVGDRARDHLADRALVDGILSRRRRRGRGCRRSHRRRRAADQAEHLSDQRVFDRARRNLLRPVHLLHRSEHRLQLQRLGRGGFGVDRRRHWHVVGARRRHRLAGSDFGAVAKLAWRRPWRRAIDGLQPDPHRGDPMPAIRADRRPDRCL